MLEKDVEDTRLEKKMTNGPEYCPICVSRFEVAYLGASTSLKKRLAHDPRCPVAIRAHPKPLPKRNDNG